jgi:hypothetical protein
MSSKYLISSGESVIRKAVSSLRADASSDKAFTTLSSLFQSSLSVSNPFPEEKKNVLILECVYSFVACTAPLKI